MESLALDSPKLDKDWLCDQCLPATQIYKIGSLGGNNNTGAAIRRLKKDHKIAYNEEERAVRQAHLYHPRSSHLCSGLRAQKLSM